MKKNKKQWMKYVAVVLAFVVMAGLFWPGNKAEVKATETGSSVSGGNVETGELTAWSIGVVYDLGTEDATWGAEYEIEIKPVSGSYFINIPTPDPVRQGYEFVGWTKANDNTKYKAGNMIEILAKDTNESTQITFTAQWQENPYVTILYKSDETTAAEEKRYHSDDAEELTIDFTLDCFKVDPERPGYLFAGWKCDLDGNVYSKASPAVFKWNNVTSSQIVFTMQWEWDGKSITESGRTYSLKAGTPYILDTGTWNVSGDDYSYTGGNTFYVGTDGDYTFTKN